MSEFVSDKYPGLVFDKDADPAVLGFILGFLSHEGDKMYEALQHLFRSGYCYYFANLLKLAFDRGQICLAYPYGHIIWLDGSDETRDIAYDAEGVCQEYEHLIPVAYLGDTVQDFMHVPGKEAFADKAKCEQIYQAWLADQKAAAAGQSPQPPLE